MSTYTPQDETALKLAAIRWYMLSLEKLSNDLYITDRRKYAEVEEILKRAFHELIVIRKSMASVALEDGCGPGYVNCNGICLPDCEASNY